MKQRNSIVAACALLPLITPTAGVAQTFQLCVQQNAGFVVAIPEDQTCDQIPGNWSHLDSGDTDWTGAGTGEMRTGYPADRVGVGDIDPQARLHVGFTGEEEAAVIVENPQSGLEAMRVRRDGRTVLGGENGDTAQLTVNAPEGAEAIRAH